MSVVQQTKADPIVAKLFSNIQSGDAAVTLIDRANYPSINDGNLHTVQKQTKMFANAIFVDKASCDFRRDLASVSLHPARRKQSVQIVVV